MASPHDMTSQSTPAGTDAGPPSTLLVSPDATEPPRGDGAGRLPELPGYRVESLIGRGGMGRVYCARDRQLGRRVAIKCLIDPDSEVTLRRFVEEAKTVSGLRHPNVAQLYEFRADHDPPFLVMEYLAGGTLAEYLAGKPLAGRPAARIVATLARAVDHAHRQRIIHRDLKPGNVLLEADDRAPGADPGGDASGGLDPARLKIVDFGLAKQLSLDSGLTRSGEVVGTPAYMSPEQASGLIARIGPATDVYALGAILYETLTGRPPFAAPDPIQTLMMVIGDDVVPPRQLVRSVPPDLQTVCLKCLEKKASRRYATAGELADDLERFLRGEPIRARPTSRWQRAVKWARRRPWQATALGTIGLSLAGAAAGLYALGRVNGELTRANGSLADANRRTGEAFALTQESLDRIVDRVRNDLYDVPGAGDLTVRTVVDSADVHRKLARLRPDSVETARRLAAALDILRLTLWRNGDREASRPVTRELEGVLDAALARFPGDVVLAAERIRLTLETLDEREPADRTATAERAARDLERLLAEHPTHPLVRRVASSYERHETDAAVAAGDLPAVLEHARKRVRYSEEYADRASAADRTAAGLWLVHARLSLADYLAAAGEWDGLREIIPRAQGDLDRLDRAALSETEYREASARLHELRGKAAQSDGDAATAAGHYRRAAEEWEWHHGRFPEVLATTTALAQVRLRLAVTLRAAGQVDEADLSLKRAEELADEALKQVPDDYLAGVVKRQAQQVRASVGGAP